MNRRSLLKSLAGLATAPLIAAGILKKKPITHAIGPEPSYGTYQFVGTTAEIPCAGLAVFWADRENYLVTPIIGEADDLAGISHNPIDKGNYGFIQTSST